MLISVFSSVLSAPKIRAMPKGSLNCTAMYTNGALFRVWQVVSFSVEIRFGGGGGVRSKILEPKNLYCDVCMIC
jgi:hypothetical protein